MRIGSTISQKEAAGHFGFYADVGLALMRLPETMRNEIVAMIVDKTRPADRPKLLIGAATAGFDALPTSLKAEQDAALAKRKMEFEKQQKTAEKSRTTREQMNADPDIIALKAAIAAERQATKAREVMLLVKMAEARRADAKSVGGARTQVLLREAGNEPSPRTQTTGQVASPGREGTSNG